MDITLKNLLIVKLAIQFLRTVRDAFSYNKPGSIKGTLLWFYLLNKVSLFGNGAGKNKHETSLTKKLRKHAFQEMPTLSSKTVKSLVKFFLEKSGTNKKDLGDYFEDASKEQFVRSQQVDISQEKLLFNTVCN